MVKILVVDDSVFERDITDKALKDMGFDTDVASNYDEAVERYDDSVDLVLLDILMEGKNGIEILKTIKQKYPDAKVVLVSSLPSEELEKLKEENGADDFIAKPVSPEEITRVIEAYVQKEE
jgi:two-component system response regulator CpxR